MFFSTLLIPLLKNYPSEAKIKSHKLMLRTGMIKQSSAGIYSWLPLGFKIMKKIILCILISPLLFVHMNCGTLFTGTTDNITFNS